ncbi:Aliphatic amidase expression-regulating protein (plasmid) [Aminobacter sp. MSH1]|nr:Aliphatic amidase expression-regulating protein [Aminobacter sp. MSH1]
MTSRSSTLRTVRSGPPDIASRLKARQELRIALCVPIGGIAGIWGPSSLASAKLAVAELNQGSGIAGYPCTLTMINATDDDPDVESTLCELVEFGEVDALIGMHTSSVRQRVISAVGGRIPFVYTPMYEGGENTPGVFAIGETTEQQLRPAIEWISRSHRVKRWVFVANDYVWAHASNSLARRYVGESGGAVLAEHRRPFGTTDYSQIIDQVRSLRADAVLVSLIGQDQVEFNRAFGASDLSGSVLRLSCTVAENELLGIGAENTENLFVSSSYFAALNTDANMSFKERYHGHFGDRAPTLNSFGESTYEGVHFLAALIECGALGPLSRRRMSDGRLAYRSARGAPCTADAKNSAPIYMARADGHCFSVLARL